MKRELWPKIRVGSFVIYADEYDGVHRAKVIETDIRIYTERVTPPRSYPYGLTKETGTVKIQYDTQEKIENLQNLITHSPRRLAALRKSWDQWQDVKAAAEAYREAFLAGVAKYKEQ